VPEIPVLAHEFDAATASRATVCDRLGHKDAATTLALYVRAFDACRRSASRRERLSALYGTTTEAGR
jgi:hypothetical protein